MKYSPIITDRFKVFSHEVCLSDESGMIRTVFQAWFHSEDVPKPVCIVTINESFMDYVEWVHVDEQYRRQGIATEVMRAIADRIPGITLEGATDAGEAWCDHYERLYPSCLFGVAPQDHVCDWRKSIDGGTEVCECGAWR